MFYERNQLEPALRHVEEGISLARQLISTQTLAIGLATLAWIRQALGDPAAARSAMVEADQVILNWEMVALYNPVPVERIRLLLIQGVECVGKKRYVVAALNFLRPHHRTHRVTDN